MSYNPGRRLKREALRGEGWRTSKPKSGRARGASRINAERNVALVRAVLDARAKEG